MYDMIDPLPGAFRLKMPSFTVAWSVVDLVMEVRRTGKRNSDEDWTTASNPTKAQGTIAMIRRIWTTTGLSAENAGPIEAIPPLCPNSAAMKQTTTPAASTNAQNV